MEIEAVLDRMSEFFERVDDPRRDHSTKWHPLESILMITLLGVIGGADDIKGVHMWAEDRYEWLQERLFLPNGLPSYSTFTRVLGRVDPLQFGRVFRKWTRVLALEHEELVALDGKVLRGSGGDDEEMVHLINVWAARNDLVMAQLPVEDDSNEIPAMTKMLRRLDVQYQLVTIDAIGCQTDLAEVITAGGGDYLLRVKANQQTLHDEIQSFFEWALDEERPDDQEVDLGYAETVNGGHGRIEKRRCWTSEQLDGLSKVASWPEIQGIVMVETERHVDGEIETQQKYYVTSEAAQTDNDAEHLLGSSRDHWGIENKVHWVLDVAFSEDQSRIQTDKAAANLSAVRKMARNLLDKESTVDAGIKNKRLKASRNIDYLVKVLKGFTQLE